MREREKLDISVVVYYYKQWEMLTYFMYVVFSISFGFVFFYTKKLKIIFIKI